MGAVGLKTFADLRRRRLQAVAIGLVLFLSSGAGTLALSVLVESHAPFERAFDAANGAHLVIDYAAGTDAARLRATGTAGPVTAFSGPWPLAPGLLGDPKGGLVEGASISGRPESQATSPGVVDRITPTAGRWWQQAGEAVLDQQTASRLDKAVGETIDVYLAPTGPVKGGSGSKARPGPVALPTTPAVTLTIVGIARSVSTPDVALWTSPQDVMTIAGGRAPLQEMLYRVSSSGSVADLTGAAAQITAGLPASVVASTATYLDRQADVDRLADLYVPVLLAFSVFALLAAIFSIANVVSGIVLAGRREIGVMQAIGFTPTQVVRILVGQVLGPVLVGAVAGTAIGSLASLPVLADTAASFGLPATALVPLPVLIGVVLASLGLAAIAAIGPAWSAGRLGPVRALAGDAATVGPAGRALRSAGLRLPTALPLRLGIATAVAHPLRAAMTLGALLVGVAAITFSTGLNASLLRVKDQLDRTTASPIRVELRSGDPTAVGALLAARPETAHVVGIAQADVDAGRLGTVPFVAYDGDASWTGYELVHGRWFAGPGEAVAPTNVFTVTGLHLGDSLTLSTNGRSVTVRLVGETFEQAREAQDDLVLRGTWADLANLAPGSAPDRWELQPTAGTDIHAYWSALQSTLGLDAQAFDQAAGQTDASFLLFLGVVGLLGAVLTGISLGGVFNTVLLETRQRSRELAILKAVGLTPRQVVAIVIASVVPLGIVAGLVGVPLGIGAQHAVLAYMGQVAAKTNIPASTFDVFGPAMLIGLSLAGLAIGAIGAWLPAMRAARARIAPVLAAE
jgi:putative ABC transport system permease protein